jgi:mannan endo-1,4-beta-mannosidase
MKFCWKLVVSLLVLLAACSGESETKHEAPHFKSSMPVNGALDVPVASQVTITFDEVVEVKALHGITINDQAAEAVVSTLSLTTIVLNVALEHGTEYVVRIPAGAVVNTFGVALESPVEFAFTTLAEVDFTIDAHLVVSNPSPEAVKLYDFLKAQYGTQSLSGTMSHVSWNINEAEWVKQHTGKYPVIATVDYIHLQYAPANWIDYNVTGFLEDWWAANGLVSAGWHWVVPQSEAVKDDPSKFTYKPEETTFSAANALVEGTWENEIVKADLEEMADYLLLLKDKNIPVIWRPLHEAAGNIYEYNNGTAWFWWGAKGANHYKALWIYMFEYFESRGLNNLLWVWTTQTKDDPFYPGDAYVDMVGRDIYNNGSETDMADQFAAIQASYPNKMVTLSEFGNVATFSKQWNAGAHWSFFMPWYDYNRTLDPGSVTFENEDHEFAPAAWWQNAAAHEAVLWREDMPDLK